MFDHVGVQATDVDAAAQWYGQVLAPLSIREAVRFPAPGGLVVGFAATGGPPAFWLSPVPDGLTVREENHLAFTAGSRGQIDEVHRAAVAAGSEVLNAPREWPEYHQGYYAVFLRDPDGNNVEAVCHQPE